MKNEPMNIMDDEDLKQIILSIREKTKDLPPLNLEESKDNEEDKERYFYQRHYGEVCNNLRYAHAKITDFNIIKGSLIYDYISNFKNNIDNGIGLLLCGGVGNGKTRLSYALARLYIKSFNDYKLFTSDVKHPIVVEFPDLFKNLWSKERSKHYWDKYTECDLLIIDDFLIEDVDSKGYQSTLYDLINKRYKLMKTTIYTANFMKDELIGLLRKAIYDRIVNTCDIYEVKGKSRRSRYDKIILD